MVLSMSKVVFQMVALGFEDIVIFIFGSPATSARTDDGCHRFWVEAMVRDQGIVVRAPCPLTHG